MGINVIVIFSILSIALSLEWRKCKTVYCGVTNSTNRCVSVNNQNKSVEINTCAAGYECASLSQFSNETGNWANVKCNKVLLGNSSETHTPNLTIPNNSIPTGQRCENDTQCMSNNCSQGICQGLSQGANCTVDDECEPNFFCGVEVIINQTNTTGNSSSGNASGGNASSGNASNTTSSNGTSSNGTNVTVVGNNTNITIVNATNVTILNSTNVTINTSSPSNSSLRGRRLQVTTPPNITVQNSTNVTIIGGNVTVTNSSTTNSSSNSSNTSSSNSTNQTGNSTNQSSSNITQAKVCIAAVGENESCSRDQQCKVGLGCNLGNCTKYFSLPLGVNASKADFCRSNFLKNGTCSGLEIFANHTRLVFPYSCNISTNCSYHYYNSSQVHTSERCQCDGIHNDTGFCPIVGSVIGFWDIVYPKLQYSSSNCSGLSAHSSNATILHDCGSISDDAFNYFEAMEQEAKYWTLAQSGAINSCSKELGLFDPTMGLNSFNSSGYIVAISLLFLLFF